MSSSRSRLSLLTTITGLVLLASPAVVPAQTPGPKNVGQTSDLIPEPLRGVNIEQRLGETIPLDARFTNSQGESVVLDDLVGERPALLLPVYYDCPMLCGMVLETAVKSLRTLKLDVGSDFDVVVFSFDPLETVADATAARRRVVKDYGRDGGGSGWHFLVGDEFEVKKLTDAIGFTANRDPATGDFAHAAALFVLTPEGNISRLFFGLSFPPRDLRLALVEAGQGSIGNMVDQVLLYCFVYDPATGRYSAAILRIVRAAGILTSLAIATFVFVTWRRERSRTLREQTHGGAA